MSYDLAVFDPDVAPRSRAEFRRWFDEQTQWEESHGYSDLEIPVPALKSWFRWSDEPSGIWILGAFREFHKGH